ncbi:PREDICTED: zinc carboxypeptidase-like [Trachymyrmex cornetzi]|uniref:zinc carboxypeptidase-like n=1 Tax=Trachymyrmex cornetzi TaxID=471704 RepID=UPI00084F4A29|nr:PREDICTED: zinc carboxypeptidase-like [Trachymyrmex cornetzi]
MTIMWSIILCTIVGLVASKQVTFDNHKVFKITTTTSTRTELFNRLAKNSDGFSFWKASSVSKQVDLMVAPHKLPEFYEMMAQIQAPYEVYIENVQTLINRAAPANVSMKFDFKNYHHLDTIYKNLDDLAKQYPDIVQIIVGGRTYEGRKIKGVKVSFKANNPGVFIESCIHAREWITPATAMYIFHQLLTSNNTEVRTLAESHDWYIFPVFNPDGYVYTHTTNRFWRKTRKPYGRHCYGCDPNRNWDYKWNTGGSSNDPCSEIYAGPMPFSEIETKSMSKYIHSISDKFYAYIGLHSYSQLLMFPYGYTTDRIDNYDNLYDIGMKTITALAKRYGTNYTVGSIAETIYVASGNTIDWIKGAYNKSIIYTYELRDEGQYGFLLPPEQIIPTGEETLDSIIAMLKEAKIKKYC